MKGSAEHSRCTFVDRPSRSADEQLHNNAPHRKCLRKKMTACVSLFVYFTIRRGTFPCRLNTDTTSSTGNKLDCVCQEKKRVTYRQNSEEPVTRL